MISSLFGKLKPCPSVVNQFSSNYTMSIMRGSKWGNPFIVGRDGTRKQVIDKFKQYAQETFIYEDWLELEGEILGCCCKPKPCHGDVLVELYKENVWRKGKNYE